MTATTFDYSQPMVESGNMTQTVESFNVHLNNIKPAFGNGMYLLKKGLLYIGRHFMGIKSASYSIKTEEEGKSVEVSKINFEWVTFEVILCTAGVVTGIILGNVGVAGAITFSLPVVALSVVLGCAGVGIATVIKSSKSVWNKIFKSFKSFWAWLWK